MATTRVGAGRGNERVDLACRATAKNPCGASRSQVGSTRSRQQMAACCHSTTLRLASPCGVTTSALGEVMAIRFLSAAEPARRGRLGVAACEPPGRSPCRPNCSPTRNTPRLERFPTEVSADDLDRSSGSRRPTWSSCGSGPRCRPGSWAASRSARCTGCSASFPRPWTTPASGWRVSWPTSSASPCQCLAATPGAPTPVGDTSWPSKGTCAGGERPAATSRPG